MVSLTLSFAAATLLATAASAQHPGNGGLSPKRHARAFGGHLEEHKIARRDVGLAVLLAVPGAPTSATSTKTASGTSSTAAVKLNSTTSAVPLSLTSIGVWSKYNGAESACLQYNEDSDLVIGMPSKIWPIAEYNWGAHPLLCGQSVNITNLASKKSIIATAWENSGQADYTSLSVGAFEALGGNLDDGQLDIEFYFPHVQVLSNGTYAAYNGNFTSAEAGSGVTRNSTAPSTSAVATVSGNGAKAVATEEVASSTSARATTTAPSQTTTTAAPRTTTTSSVNYASISSASAAAAAAREEAAEEAAAAAAASSSKAAAAAASSSSSAAAAAASASARAEAEAEAAAAAAEAEKAAAAAEAEKAAAAAAAAASASKSRAAAEAQETPSSSSGNGKTHSGGYATYFFQNGVAGNCGTVAQDTDYVIALPTNTYANGAHCGAKVKVTRVSDGRTVVGTVRDSCPTCINDSCLDLSESMFKQIATAEEGQVGITWQFI